MKLQVFLQGGVDHEGSVTGRFNNGWNANNVTKLQAMVNASLLMYRALTNHSFSFRKMLTSA